ncbi:hypothetical protein [uncultured Lactobacillus sp.]|uniref:hypothetical protein n=1 Tax=uncultured Lactobacillus sp. TaxID=153152 RepID=UPI0026223A60|nr:hypothetical protein [uncultured Lactobacillus sp.]
MSQEQFRVSLIKDAILILRINSLREGDYVAGSNQIFNKNEPAEDGFHGLKAQIITTENGYSLLAQGYNFDNPTLNPKIFEMMKAYRQRVLKIYNSATVKEVICKLQRNYDFVAPYNE